MPVKLFSLRGVPEDEAEEVRELLTGNGIDYYETPAGNWGISSPAIWLNKAGQLEKAKSLIEQYQNERRVRVRAEFEQLRSEGKAETVLDRIKSDPVRFVLYLALALFILYVSIQPFIDFGK